MTRPLDHLVLAVDDLDAAGRFYERLGFLVGARNRHPWGTENRIIQTDEVFLELITLGDGAQIEDHAKERFSFGAFVRDYLDTRQGFAMLVLASGDARADKADFDRAGIGGFAPFDFARKAKRPDGSEVDVAFSLSFAKDPLAPQCGFFVCEQHHPENFWNKTMQSHPNGVTHVANVTMVAKDPADHAEFLSAFIGSRAFSASSAGLRFETPHGGIDCLSEEAFAFEFGFRFPGEGARLAGLTLACPDRAGIEERLTAQAVPFDRHQGALVIHPDHASGVAIRFMAP